MIDTVDTAFRHVASKASAVVSFWRETASHYCYSNTIWWEKNLIFMKIWWLWYSWDSN